MVHEDDIAAVAVEALTRNRNDMQTYVLSGRRAVTQAEQMHIIGEVIGRDLHWQDVPARAVRRCWPWRWAARVRGCGIGQLGCPSGPPTTRPFFA
jgi:uncharacterized protein YbjT (DUF2867 family)